MRIHGVARYIRYRLDGSIKSVGSCSGADLIFQSRVGLFVKEIESGDTIDPLSHFVDVSSGRADTHVVALRPRMTLVLDKSTINADGTDKAIISGVPIGIVRVRAERKIVNDGIVEITSDIEGAFDVSIDAFPFVPEKIRVTAI